MSYLLHHYLETAADAEPLACAVVHEREVWQYGRLEARANQVAWALTELGCVPGDRIGLYGEKSNALVAGLYGILKTGGCYVPLDPNAPLSRLAATCRDCGIRTLVAGADTRRVLAPLVTTTAIRSIVVLDGEKLEATGATRIFGDAELQRFPTGRPHCSLVDDDLAYILSTSGSTGRPKHIMLSHRNARAFVEWAADAFDLRPSDRLANHAPWHFDLSTFDLFGAAHAGASVALVPRETTVFPVEMCRLIREQEITVWYSVPSALTLLLTRGGISDGDFPRLRTILFAGEVFPLKYLRELVRRLPHVEFANLYGPAETNVCTWHRVDELPASNDETLPIGRPIANTQVFVVKDDRSLAGTEEVGELWVRGATVMAGYWHDPVRTAEKLVQNLFSARPTELVYRTGDLVYVDQHQLLRYVGRQDAQVKSRGYRIDLGDVEAALNAHPSILESAVVAVPDELVTSRLVAFVVPTADVSVSDLRRFCRQRIPTYMVPERFEFRAVLTKTSTGKVDRQALMAGAANAK